ncbi:MAG: hypothetical protein COY53_06225 [Elusimicrobia bacterium CG_4_10_14_0_8_um_filter_37_32]|nr:MAG: hypothetical protein COS17_02680 [Elusimicrobia bacterium CG02_land_8_20_14_3_00_37_13]PIZ13173.1 MAG: hypothetical protein COY53_06225 [Elusimicrobia bacterium CG_4_10_14_0_8_um_filter_37_32]
MLTHPEFDERIPDGAQVVFNLEDNPEFNKWAVKIAHSQQEKEQRIVIVKVKGLTPLPASRLINPKLVLA